MTQVLLVLVGDARGKVKHMQEIFTCVKETDVVIIVVIDACHIVVIVFLCWVVFAVVA